jgi:hypothetical protein
MDDKELQAHTRLKDHEATVISIDQSKLHTAVRLFSLDHQLGIVPASVMADTGAEVDMCISKGVARALNLTWTAGIQLAGVGGLGGAEGQADQEIVLRIGGDGRADDVTSTPFQGCFAIRVRPVIMTEELARTIGHSSLIGMSVLWRANACIDPYTETMEISPALLKYGCAGFKISIPCFMSKPRESRHPLVSVLGFSQPPRTHDSYLPPDAYGFGAAEAAATAKPACPNNFTQVAAPTHTHRDGSCCSAIACTGFSSAYRVP